MYWELETEGQQTRFLQRKKAKRQDQAETQTTEKKPSNSASLTLKTAKHQRIVKNNSYFRACHCEPNTILNQGRIHKQCKMC